VIRFRLSIFVTTRLFRNSFSSFAAPGSGDPGVQGELSDLLDKRPALPPDVPDRSRRAYGRYFAAVRHARTSLPPLSVSCN